MQDGSTALHLAAWKNKMDVVKILINTGANYRVCALPANFESFVV